MGLFDYIKFDTGVFEHGPDMEFQTKDLACAMDTYHVTAKGEIYCDRYRVDGTYRREYQSQLTDYIVFYTAVNNEFVTYKAHFINGWLKDISKKVDLERDV